MKKLWKIISLLKNYKPYVVLNIVFNILTVIFSVISVMLVFPFLNVLFGGDSQKTSEPQNLSLSKDNISDFLNFHLQQFIETNGKPDALFLICILIISAFFLKNLFRYLALFSFAPVRNGIVRDLRQMVYDKILCLPISFFSEQKKGDLLARITSDVQEIEWSMLRFIETVVREPLMIGLSLTVMLFISPKLTAIVFILLPISGIIIGSIGKVLRRVSLLAQEQLGTVLSVVEETVSGLRIVKAFNAQNWQSDRFKTQNDHHASLMTKLFRRREMSSPLSEFLGVCVFVVILFWGGKIALTEGTNLNPALFMTFLGVFFQMINPAKAVTDAYYNIQKGLASMERIDEILDEPETITNHPNATKISTFNQKIDIKNLNFAYSEKPVLQNIDLSIKKGEMVALVGQSGAGKTTLVDLIPRFYDINEGEILIDGQNIQKIDLHSLRNLMGIVNQEAVLFNDTVFNNIAFGIKNPDLETVKSAAKVANAHHFIENLPEGYETVVGERGSKLSGGQRQRLTIARAVFKNPPILILDEATSALDSESEKLVQDALFNLMKNRTSIVIAHRLSTIQAADVIVVMKNGKIEEKGTHTQLLQQSGEYKKLVELQGL